MFANGPGDLGSISGRVIPKTQKMVLDASLLNTQHYKVRIKGKVEQSREGVAPSPTHWCSSYRKGSLRVTLDYGRQLYFTKEFHDRINNNNNNCVKKECNCKSRDNCPMNELCNLNNVIYQAIIYPKEDITDKKTYIILSSTKWKERYSNHKYTTNI